MADIQTIINTVLKYNPESDIDFITRAYEFAKEAHKEQLRDTGEPYIIHPLAVAQTLADLEMDNAAIAAAFLHDVVEDQDVTIDDIKAKFGDEVARLVDGVTKLRFADFDVDSDTDEDAQKTDVPKKKRTEFHRSAENLRKIFLAMAKDLRVMVIKLADRLHNLTTLESLSPERQKKMARETLQIYAPLAHRLGIWRLKWELEDLAFRYLEPEKYAEISEKVAKTREAREEDLAEAVEMLQKHLAKVGIDAYIQSRPKHLWSIYNKILKEEVDFEEIYDLSALRVVVNRVEDCYHALGLVHDLWMPIPERFADYIAKPKSNMYQSLHTKVIGPRGEPLEVQIRTWDMHRLSEFGVAAHWQYKERMRSGDEFERKLSWLRQQLFDWQSDSRDAGEFLHSVINDLFTDQVFVFTPRGDVIDLPAGSTPVDFAYRIHSDVGNHCVGGKVNGKIVNLQYKFSNGDIVEIISRTNAQPSLDWLTFVKTSHAKNRIRGYFRKLHFAENVIKGREMLEKELERNGLDGKGLTKTGALENLARQMHHHNEEDLLAALGYGHTAIGTVINKLKGEDAAKRETVFIEQKPSGQTKLSVTLDGVKNLLIQRAKCCMPLPGEEIIGYVTRGKGVTLHTSECPNIIALKETEAERLVAIDWQESVGERYPTELKLKVLDRVGMLNDLTALISEAKTNITGARIKSLPDKTADVDITVEVTNIVPLNSLMLKVSTFPDVLRIERVSAKTTASRKKK